VVRSAGIPARAYLAWRKDIWNHFDLTEPLRLARLRESIDMTTKLGVMVVGPGWVAGEHIKSFVANKNTEVRCIVGILPEDRDRARAYMHKYGFQCDYTEDYAGALARRDIDIVSICTINSAHAPQALQAVRAAKHVLVEKPLCLTFDHLKQLRTETQRMGVGTHVGHVCRYYPAPRALYNFIREGAIGEVFYVESDYWHDIKGIWKVKKETAGSALLMGAIHSVDMVRWLMGEEHDVAEVFAYSNRPVWRKDFEYDPTIAMLIKFDSGAIGRVGTSLECNMPYVFHMQANGTKGTVRNNGLFSEKFPAQRGFMSIPADYPDDWNVAQHPFPTEINYFVDCIVNRTDSELSFPRAYKTYELVFAAEMSAREGRPVKLPLA
jgi:predicted dehydrogenase